MEQFFIEKTLELFSQRIDFMTQLANTCHTWMGICVGIVITFCFGTIGYGAFLKINYNKKIKKLNEKIDEVVDEALINMRTNIYEVKFYQLNSKLSIIKIDDFVSVYKYLIDSWTIACELKQWALEKSRYNATVDFQLLIFDILIRLTLTSNKDIIKGYIKVEKNNPECKIMDNFLNVLSKLKQNLKYCENHEKFNYITEKDHSFLKTIYNVIDELKNE
jgi:hypothetical protein